MNLDSVLDTVLWSMYKNTKDHHLTAGSTYYFLLQYQADLVLSDLLVGGLTNLKSVTSGAWCHVMWAQTNSGWKVSAQVQQEHDAQNKNVTSFHCEELFTIYILKQKKHI